MNDPHMDLCANGKRICCIHFRYIRNIQFGIHLRRYHAAKNLMKYSILPLLTIDFNKAILALKEYFRNMEQVNINFKNYLEGVTVF